MGVSGSNQKDAESRANTTLPVAALWGPPKPVEASWRFCLEDDDVRDDDDVDDAGDDDDDDDDGPRRRRRSPTTVYEASTYDLMTMMDRSD